MKRLVLLLLVVFLSVTGTARSQALDEQSLREELDRVFRALGEGDAAYFEDHYVSDVSRIHLSGGVDLGWSEERAAGIKRSMERGWRFRTESYEVPDLRIYGNVAITAGVATAVQTRPGAEEPEELNFRFSYVWIKQDGRWRELHHHVSRQ